MGNYYALKSPYRNRKQAWAELGQAFRTALTRQITEAIRIRKREASVLNSKGELDRCRIHRLTIESERKPDGGKTTTEKKEDKKEDVMGEQLLWGKRKAINKGRLQRKEEN